MPNNLFGVDIAGIVNDAIAPGLLPMSITKTTPGTRTDSTGGTNPTEVSYPGRGVVTEYKDSEIDGTVVKRGDRKVLMITESFPIDPEPQDGDKVTIEKLVDAVIMGETKRDPAGATYTSQVRPK